MEAFIGGLILLFLAIKLAAGFVFVSTQLADRFLPNNAQAQRFAPALLVAAIVTASYVVADLSKISFWWIAIPLAIVAGIAGWILSNRAEREAEEARRMERLANMQRAKEIYRQYEASPYSLNDPSFRAEFSRYWDWSTIRADVISSWRQGDKRCNGCATFIRGKSIHVDHIQPRSKHPHLGYLKSNLQVLCDRCNRHKHDYDGDDWREVIADRKKAHAKRRRIQRQRNA
jgi:5-methylcytosine-specific restriction endonuclease McrA